MSEGMNQAASVLQAEETYQAFTGLDAVISVMNEEGRELSAMVNQLIAQKQEAAEAMAAEAERGQTAMLSVQAGVLGAGLLLLVLISVLTLRSIITPLKRASRFTLQIAGGNLAAHVPPKRRDEIGQLMDSLNTMRKSLSNIISDVKVALT
ncbi:hypothetical protein HAALTHF_07470n [Vreelandella aquamarina]|nr:hypothetical protein HAALTHF_07470n [Halomonas axialensis]